MKPLIFTCIFSLAIALPAWAAHANAKQDRQPHARAYDMPGHDPIGKPGNGSAITRTIHVNIKETANGSMLFEPDAIHIARGSVVRFVINNSGAIEHEFFLGSFDEVGEHRQWMRKHPDMRHEEGNAVVIPSGQTAELVWEFSNIINLEFVCLIPGHREAGMWGVIMVHHHLAPRSKG